MFRKAILLAVVLFVVVPGAWLGVEHVRGRRRLEAVLEAQRVKGEELDVLRLFGGGDHSASNQLAAQVSAVNAMRDAGALLPPAFQMVASGRAVPATRIDRWGGPGQGSSNTWEELEAWVRGHAGDLADLRKALGSGTRRADLDLSVGFARMSFAHLAPIKNSATSLSVASSAAMRRGEFDAALADLALMGVIQEDLAGEPILISQLVRVACVSIANARYWTLLHSGDWDDGQLARLQAALPRRDLGAPLARSLEGERAVCLRDIRRESSAELASMWSASEQLMAGLGGMGPTPLEMPSNAEEAVEFAGELVRRMAEVLRLRVLFPVWRFGWGDHATAHYLEAMDALISAARAGVAAGSQKRSEEVDMLAWFRPSPVYRRLNAVYANALIPALLKALNRGFRTETEIDLNATGVALRRYRLRHGRYPESLEALVPRFLAAVPVDRLDGKPLRYRRDAEDRFLLWSVGEDGEDGGGNAEWAEGKRGVGTFNWWGAADAVWPQLASVDEEAAFREEERKREARAKKSGMNAPEELLRRYGLLPRSDPATSAPPAEPRPAP